MASSFRHSLLHALFFALCISATLASWWQPKPGTTWQWQLSALPIDTSYAVEMYDIDLFDAPQATIDLLHSQGKKVICYYSAGSYEDWRADASSFPSSVLGNNLDGWPGERWLDVTKITSLAPIMRARLDLAKAKRCDGVEPDNVDGYAQDSGFSISYAQQITYNKWTATEAHARNLSVGLKNDLNQITDLLSSYDFAVNEECVTYNECGLLNPFVAANKAVFGCMYAQAASTFCASSIASGFSFIKKNLALDSSVTFCLPANFVPTQAPTTEAPTATPTAAPTVASTTLAPTTKAPTTLAPTTKPPTAAPTTLAPTTLAPTTKPPTAAPTTLAPTTQAPTSQAPSTPAPTTDVATLQPVADSTTSTTADPTTAAPTAAPTTTSSTYTVTVQLASCPSTGQQGYLRQEWAHLLGVSVSQVELVVLGCTSRRQRTTDIAATIVLHADISQETFNFFVASLQSGSAGPLTQSFVLNTVVPVLPTVSGSRSADLSVRPTPLLTTSDQPTQSSAQSSQPAFVDAKNSSWFSGTNMIIIIVAVVVAGVVMIAVVAFVGYKIFMNRDPTSKNPFRNSRQLQDVDELQLYGLPSTNSNTHLV